MGKKQTQLNMFNRPLFIASLLWLYFILMFAGIGSAKDVLQFITLTTPVTFGLFLGTALDIGKEELKARGKVFKFPRKILYSFLLWLVFYYALAVWAISQQSSLFQFYLTMIGTPIGVFILGLPYYQMDKLGKTSTNNDKE